MKSKWTLSIDCCSRLNSPALHKALNKNLITDNKGLKRWEGGCIEWFDVRVSKNDLSNIGELHLSSWIDLVRINYQLMISHETYTLPDFPLSLRTSWWVQNEIEKAEHPDKQYCGNSPNHQLAASCLPRWLEGWFRLDRTVILDLLLGRQYKSREVRVMAHNKHYKPIMCLRLSLHSQARK